MIKGLAERALRKHQYATAEELCDKALKALGGSSDVKESERKLRVRFAAARGPRGRHALSPAMACVPRRRAQAETLLVRSLARVKLDRLDEAEVDALSAIADAPQLLLGYVRLGVIHTQASDPPQRRVPLPPSTSIAAALRRSLATCTPLHPPLQRGAWNSAARVLRQGEKEFAKSTAVNNPTTVIQKTLDHVAVDGALHGCGRGLHCCELVHSRM